MAAKILLGELLIQNGVVDKEIIGDALRIQVGGNRRLGNILVRMKKLTEDQLVEMLATQLDIPVTDIVASFTPEVGKKLPRYLCRQYDVIPLKLKKNNILEVAMADPSDHQAICDIEQYTGHVVEPKLARQSDIAVATTRCIPYSFNDFFSPRAGQRFTRIALAVCLVLIVAVGSFSYRYIHNAKYGTVSTSAGATIYKNHDLMLGVDSNGTINLLGRGAFAGGYYSVTFKDIEVLNAFLAGREKDFSENQKEWLRWVLGKVGGPGTADTITASR